MTEPILRVVDWLVKAFSFEWLMAFSGRPNGGEIVFFRSLLVSAWMFVLYIAVTHGVDPARTGVLSSSEFRAEITKSLPYFGAILAAVYLALYARFSSQWSYLAQLYNDIKASELQAPGNTASDSVLAQWKAGFIEDASDLHLATKRTFAPVIKAWGTDPAVRAAFERFTPGGATRLDALLVKANEAYTRNARAYR